MPELSTKPVIFISYSHKDEPERPGSDDIAWLTFVQSFLAPVVRIGIFDIWVDEHLHGGDALNPEIKVKLAACDIFVLLVSRHSLASTYVVETEIATMRQRQRNGEDVHIFPIVLSPVPNAALKQLKDLVLKPKDGKPLSLMLKNDREVAMADIADDIAAIAEELAQKKTEAIFRETRIRQSLSTATEQRHQFPANSPSVIDTIRLPETAYESLVGRDAELKQLDDAWADPKTNILSLVAEGGAGKSSLVNEWLKRLQAVNYRGAEAVLGWSFYSQGSKERATAADEFLNWALGKLNIKVATTSVAAKAEAIAEAMMRRRVLLLLDGVEPLQHGLDAQIGQLKDQGLRGLLRRFATTPPGEGHGLIVLTSRLAVKDLTRWQDGPAPVVNVERLSDEAGASLLRENGVWATGKELKEATRDFGGHPLALSLLASFLKDARRGDVRRRDHIRAYLSDPDNPRHDHAKRVMESYEKEWLTERPVPLAIMFLIGLFDRPASSDCLKALRQIPAIEGLTDQIVTLDDDEWQRAIALLRAAQLLAPLDSAAADALDAHPLVREWFGERLKETNERAWKAAHSRLYEHLRDSTDEGEKPTLEKLAPLYQAISHGCRAGRHQDALSQVYYRRILRGQTTEFYSIRHLGSIATDLAALFWFFEKPYYLPISTLTPDSQAWVVNIAGSYLGLQARVVESLQALEASQQMTLALGDWRGAASNASQISSTQLNIGEISIALEFAMSAIEFSKKVEGTDADFIKLAAQTNYARTLFCAGLVDEASAIYRRVERRHQRIFQKKITSLPAFQYCELLVDQGAWLAARRNAAELLLWATRVGFLRDIALGRLALGKASLLGALRGAESQHLTEVPVDVIRDLSEIDGAVAGLVEADLPYLVPNALLARSAYRRCVGNWEGAARDLDEVGEIAAPAPMRLFLCDMAIERARLSFARIEQFAPLDVLGPRAGFDFSESRGFPGRVESDSRC